MGMNAPTHTTRGRVMRGQWVGEAYYACCADGFAWCMDYTRAQVLLDPETLRWAEVYTPREGPALAVWPVGGDARHIMLAWDYAPVTAYYVKRYHGGDWDAARESWERRLGVTFRAFLDRYQWLYRGNGEPDE